MEAGTGVAAGCILRLEPPEFADRRGCGRKRGTKDASENSGLSRRRAERPVEAGVEGGAGVMSRGAPASVGCSQCSACAHRFTDAPQHPKRWAPSHPHFAGGGSREAVCSGSPGAGDTQLAGGS